MRKLAFLSFVGLSLMSSFGVQMNYQLMKSKYADPTLMTSWYSDDVKGRILHPIVAFTPDGNTDAYTWMFWAKKHWKPDSQWDERRSLFDSLFVQQFFTIQEARSTAEGNNVLLDNICDWEYDTYLTLSYGSWSKANVLPTDYDWKFGGDGVKWTDADTELTDWQYGCFTVNIETDSDLTLVIGGYEKQVYASNEKQIFNVKCETADRSVSVSAESSSAHVKLGIAVNPLKRFYGQDFQLIDPDGNQSMDRREQWQGINAEEYTMVVCRARILDANTLECNISALGHNIDYWQHTMTNRIDQPKNSSWYSGKPALTKLAFEKNSRLSVSLFAMSGLYKDSEGQESNCDFWCYGSKVFKGWLSNDFISTIRDLDVVEMRKRGLEFMEDSDYWEPTYTQRTSEAIEGISSVTIYEDQPGAEISANQTLKSFTREVVCDIRNGAKNDTTLLIEDFDLACSSALSISNNVLTFNIPSTNTVTWIHRATGNRKTKTVICSGKQREALWDLEWVNTFTAGTPLYRTTTPVIDALTSAQNDGKTYSATAWNTPFQYKKWQSRRLPVLPAKSTAGLQGHRSMAVLSPHTYVSAAHYGWWVGGTETYISADHSITSVVKTTGSMTSLKTWALNHGFTAEQVNACTDIGDIVVGRFTEGTVDNSCVPYLMSTNTAAYNFNKVCTLCWHGTQTFQGYGNPSMIWPDIGSTWFSRWSDATGLDTVSYKRSLTGSYTDQSVQNVSLAGILHKSVIDKRDAMLTSLGTNTLYLARIYPGDSGLPVYLDLGNDKYILVSTHHTATSGPSYVQAFEILKAWIEANGDSVKEWTNFNEE